MEVNKVPQDFWLGRSAAEVLTGMHTELKQRLLYLEGYVALLCAVELSQAQEQQIKNQCQTYIGEIKELLEAVHDYLGDLNKT